MSRILIAGVAGVLGSNLAERFLRDGHSIIGVDDLSTGRMCNVEPFLANQRFEWWGLDIVDEWYESEIWLQREKIDWILNFSAAASLPKYSAESVKTLRTLSEGTHHLLELAKTQKAKFLIASTSEVYGDPLVYPQPETYWGNVNPIGVRSMYDEGKRFSEALTMAYHRTYGLSTRIIRIFNTHGPNLDPLDGRIIPNFITQALTGKDITVYGDGSQMRSFQYVDDLIEGILRLMEVEYHLPVNLGNPEEWSVLDLANLVIELTGSKSKIVYLPLPEDDPRRRKPDITLAKTLLGWEPKISVRDGLMRTIDYFRKELAIA